MTDYGSLLTLRELRLQGPAAVLRQLGDQLEAELPSEAWNRDKEKEASWRESGFGDDGTFVFVRQESGVLPRASLFLHMEGDSAEITNIVPLDVSELRADQYNAIIEDFLTSGLGAVIDKLGLALQVTDGVQPITTWLSNEAAKKLWSFSRLANHSTGSAHPKDRERWLSFIIQAHQDNCELSASLLERWLIEVEQWYSDDARDLAIEYEFGRELLKQFSHRLA